jgi:hypothetical protein
MGDQRLVEGLAKLAQAVTSLADRVERLEKARAESERTNEVLQAAQRSWRVLAQVRDRLLIGTEAGDLAQIPVAVAKVLAAGRPLDLDAREAGADVELLDRDGRVAACLSKAALLGVGKALQSWLSQSHPSRTATRGVLVGRQPARQAASKPVLGVVQEHGTEGPVSPPVAPPVSPSGDSA